jgi:hypothetical protein
MGTPKDMLNSVFEMGVWFYRGPAIGELEGTLLS